MKQGEGNTIEQEEDLSKCVEYILEHKAGWTDFTRWYTQHKGVGHVKANRMWKKALSAISEQFKNEVSNNVSAKLLELENLKQRARQENDRRIELEATKYQAKLEGLEIERSQLDVKVESVSLKWGE